MMNTIERREMVSHVCSQLGFLVSNMDKSDVITLTHTTPSKEYGAYSCGIVLEGDSLYLNLKTKRTKRTVYSAYLKHDYIRSLSKFGWYIQSCPYKNGKKYRFLEVSLYVDELDDSCFALLLQVVSKDTHLQALSKLLDLWVEDIKGV